MKKIISLAFILIFLTACGGGGYDNTPDPYRTAPTGDFSGQVDPVQTTNN